MRLIDIGLSGGNSRASLLAFTVHSVILPAALVPETHLASAELATNLVFSSSFDRLLNGPLRGATNQPYSMH